MRCLHRGPAVFHPGREGLNPIPDVLPQILFSFLPAFMTGDGRRLGLIPSFQRFSGSAFKNTVKIPAIRVPGPDGSGYRPGARAAFPFFILLRRRKTLQRSPEQPAFQGISRGVHPIGNVAVFLREKNQNIRAKKYPGIIFSSRLRSPWGTGPLRGSDPDPLP